MTVVKIVGALMGWATVRLRATVIVVVVVVVVVGARMQWLLLLIVGQLIVVVVVGVVTIAKACIPLLSILRIVIVAARIEAAIFPFVDGIGMFGANGVRSPLGGVIAIGFARWIGFGLLAFLFVVGFGFGC